MNTGCRLHYLPEDVALARKGLLLFSVTAIANLYGEWMMFGATTTLFWLFAAKVFIVGFGGLLYFKLPSVSRPAWFDRNILIYGICFAALLFPVLASRPASYTHSFLLVLGLVLGFYVLFPIRLGFRVIPPLLLTAVSLVVLHNFKDPQSAKALQTIWGGFILVNIVGTTIAVQIDRSRLKQHRTEQDLTASEARFRLLVEKANAILYSLSPEGIFTYVSPTWTQLLGHDVKDVIGHSFEDFVHADDIPPARLFFGEIVVEGKQLEGIEYRVKHKNGEWRWHTSSASPSPLHEEVSFVGIARDITEHKRMEQELKLSEKKFSAAFHSALVAMAISTVEGGRYIDVNEAFATMTGYGHSEIVGRTAADLNFFFDSQEREVVRLAFEQTGTVRNIEMKIRTNKGQRRIGLFSFSPIRIHEQECWLSTCLDITERKNLQDRIAAEVALAGTIQRATLPEEFEDETFALRSIYQPYHGVSGDSYGFRRSGDGNRLFGYLLDVTGHGMATALQTTAVGVLLDKMMLENDALSPVSMGNLNREAASYFAEGSYAALLLFEFDLPNRRLRYAAGGINHFWVRSAALTGKRTVPGAFVGLFDDPEFQLVTLPIQAGDEFYFVTDGIDDLMSEEPTALHEGFDPMVAYLEQLAGSKERWDDCTGLCIKLKAPAGKKVLVSNGVGLTIQQAKKECRVDGVTKQFTVQ